MRPADDDALMAGMAAGDVGSAAVIVRRYQRHVFGVALAVLGDRDAAEDVAQEAFTRAWRHAGVYDPRRASVATWLGSITRNLAIDARRVRRATPTDPLMLTEILGGSGDPGPPDLVEATSEQVVLREALSRLPEAQRRAVVLASIGGRTAAEVSQVEDIPVGTAKTRIRTGLLRLRDDLARQARRSARGEVCE